ncbi:MAG: hypothetical protein I3273_06765 [Candidatus Moeniiplasma glomeromycotorum]|nr:hypothetical protein [Candidatus Moeniiplasma glomeromycotorum]MCE8169787.1 hypothetical protein [Candidatus Moeniiplasma glomeromycotorum]
MAYNVKPKNEQPIESQYNGKKIRCDWCKREKDGIEMKRKFYSSKIHCSECYSLHFPPKPVNKYVQ